MKRVLITGAEGFIGRNLVTRIQEKGGWEVLAITRLSKPAALSAGAAQADAVVHLAGVNRPRDPADFVSGNARSTQTLIAELETCDNRAPVIYASSVQAEFDNPYGASKRLAEAALLAHGSKTGAPVHIFRLPNVFGKWSRPNYNSAVATFCHNAARGLAIEVHDPDAPLHLVYIDDVVDAFIELLEQRFTGASFREIEPRYLTTVGEVADLIQSFPSSRKSLVIPPVGGGLVRALYSTYLSFLPASDFDYSLPVHADPRGEFVEMLKTTTHGQFSYFTARPGVTRGDHYHHSKVEKFLVVAGTAHFGFRHILSGETHELTVAGGEGRVVETIPGWTHNITNVGDGDLLVMLWANEIFDQDKPDTIAMEV